MELFIATILVAAAIAAYTTSLVCRWSVARNRRPAFWPAALASLCGSLVITLASGGSELFTHRYWQGTAKGPGPLPSLLIFVCVFAVPSIVPASGVVVLYRKRLKR